MATIMLCIIVRVICLYLLIQSCIFEISAAVCPTPHQWRQRGQELGCPVSQPYHCLEDEQGTVQEFCVSNIWVQPGFCPEFNSIAGKIDVRLCKEANGRCPNVTYLSADVFKYSACLPLRVALVAVSIATNTGKYQNTTTNQGMASTSTTSTHHNKISEDSADSLPVILPIVLVLLVVLTAAVITVIFRRKRNSHQEPFSTEKKLEELENEKNEKKDGNTEIDDVHVPLKPLYDTGHDVGEEKFEPTEKDNLLMSEKENISSGLKTDHFIPISGDLYFKDDVENGIRKVEQTHILVLIGGCKKDLLSIAERIGDHFGIYMVFNDFKSWNERKLNNCINENIKCALFDGCFRNKNGGIIPLHEKWDSFNRMYEDRYHVNVIITVPDSVWKIRQRPLQKSKLFFDLYVLKITQQNSNRISNEDRSSLIV